jgi:PmbA protein
MERMITLAKEYSDQVELYALDQNESTVEFEDSKLREVESTMQSGVSIRVINEGRLGFAYTKNLKDREELLQNALSSLQVGVDVKYDFPFTNTVPALDTYDRTIARATTTTMVDECIRISSVLNQRVKGQVNVDAGTTINEIRIVNSAGTTLSAKTAFYYITASILYPGSATGIHRSLVFKSFRKADDAYSDYLIELYNKGEKEIAVVGGRMKVLFMPEAMYTLVWRLQSATNGASLYHKQSPLAGKSGAKIFNEKLTIIDNPSDDSKPGARAFDDEGTACRQLTIVDKGILKNFYYDLYYGSKMKVGSTGHGFKTSRWPGDKIAMKPAPALEYLSIAPGTNDFWQLVRAMDRGLIVCGVLGAHSGNIPNGDFSVGVSPGLYVENGEITGRIKDAMIAGNIYDTMQRVIGIENRVHEAYTGYYPAVLFDGVNVATKS